MKKSLLCICLALAFVSCENNAITKPEDIAYNDLIGEWELSAYVNYSNNNEVDIIDTIPPSKNGKSLCFEKTDDNADIIVTLTYANILSTQCTLYSNNSIEIKNEWGGTELLDITGSEDKLLTLLNSIDLWAADNGKLYLIDSESTNNYNAVCLKK